MALSMFKMAKGTSGTGASHHSYTQALGKYASKQDEIVYLDNGNMPSWAKDDPNFFWQMADKHERANGRVYREHVISLPRELSDNENIELIKDWVSQEIGDKYSYSVAFHKTIASDGGFQPHMHLMYSERLNDGLDRTPETYFKRYNKKDPSKGGAKKDSPSLTRTEAGDELKALRHRWEVVANKHLKQYALNNATYYKNRFTGEQECELLPVKYVDMRNYKERKDWQPMPQIPFYEYKKIKQENQTSQSFIPALVRERIGKNNPNKDEILDLVNYISIETYDGCSCNKKLWEGIGDYYHDNYTLDDKDKTYPSLVYKIEEALNNTPVPEPTPEPTQIQAPTPKPRQRTPSSSSSPSPF